MKDKVKWGIIGLGNIAHQFAKDLLLVQDAELVAVASRDAEKSKEFAKKYDCQKPFLRMMTLLMTQKLIFFILQRLIILMQL